MHYRIIYDIVKTLHKSREGWGHMKNYLEQNSNCAPKQDTCWHEMEQRMIERLQIVKGLRLSEKPQDNNTPNIQLPTSRIS